MSITIGAPHGRTLEALSRVATLIVEHRDDIPPVYLSIDSSGLVRIQVTTSQTFSEPVRKAAVEFIARTLHLDPPTIESDSSHYLSASEKWRVFTPIHHDRCPNCSKPVIR